MMRPVLPPAGKSKEQILAELQSARTQDARWREGRSFSMVYPAGEEITRVVEEAYLLYAGENGLNPTAFPSVRKLENEVVGMVAGLLGGDSETAGILTSGGTESILMALLAARQWGLKKEPPIERPEVVLAANAHPAFDKAAHYFGLQVVRVAVREDFRADPPAMEAAINPRTVLMVGSAPTYPQGVVDPIAELAEIAQKHGILFHVDACVGGMMLPFLRRLGYPVPPFDLSLPGVTSLSVDLHKYGYAAKGASVILYRNKALRRQQFFATTDWSGGIYASTALAGTRSGGPAAAAWAVLNYLGEEGYLHLADTVMKTALYIRQEIEHILGLKVLSDPEMSLMALVSDHPALDIYDVGDELGQRGWFMDRQQFPPSLHLTINPLHAELADLFLRDLAESVALARRSSLRRSVRSLGISTANFLARWLPERWVTRLTESAGRLVGGENGGLPQRSAAMYGLLGSLPNRGDLKELVLDILDRLNS